MENKIPKELKLIQEGKVKFSTEIKNSNKSIRE